jgi:hypothetical protein
VAAVGQVAVVTWERGGIGGDVVVQPFDIVTGAPLAPVWVAAEQTGGRPAVAVVSDGEGVRGLVTWETELNPQEVWVRAFRFDP